MTITRTPRLALAALAVAALLTGCSTAVTDHAVTSTASTGPHRDVSSAAAAAAPSVLAATATTAARPAAKPVARRAAKPNPCAHNTARRFVRVSLHSQHLWMCSAHTLAYSSPITSGMAGEYTGTPTGTFHIQALDRNTVLTLNTGKQYDVKYWIPFDAPLFGFHDSPWQDFPYGSQQYRTDGSHGCVHLPLTSIAFLYRWADVGTTVTIA